MPKWLTVAFALFLSLQVFSTQGRDVSSILREVVQTGNSGHNSAQGLINFIAAGHRADLVAVIERDGRKYFNIKVQQESGAYTFYLVDIENGEVSPDSEEPVSGGLRKTGAAAKPIRDGWQPEL